MAECSCHHEQVKNLMSPKMYMFFIENMQPQSVNHTADCIHYPPDKQPKKSAKGQTPHYGRQEKDRKPPHPDIDRRGDPLWTVIPESFYDHAGDRKPPYSDKHYVTPSASQRSQTDRGVGACDKNADAHVIQLSEGIGHSLTGNDPVEGCTGPV